ncbi:hypothetical protein H5398_14765 [Tessaracoccus sp. MC1679]|uniref:hypothetical protein n=1 Tax=Tessaracoccus sp. MC1679 TaxID=2760313 RepID=UPI0016041E4E|nr:hypothetical protein [Tessaracoccus sp. MC1679]MBB1517216.1 hypothetical protein [Tessaracoccus sp. MC1679]
MSWLRRTGSGDLTPLHLDMDVEYTHQMQWHHLIPPGTSSPRTALISNSLEDTGGTHSIAAMGGARVIKMFVGVPTIAKPQA